MLRHLSVELYYLPQVTREKVRSSLNCAISFACKPLLSGISCDVRIESFRTHPGWGSGDNLIALSDVEQALVGLPARRGRTRSAAAQQCCCSSAARNRRFRGPAASTRIRSIAQEAREPPNRRSTSSSTLDGHLVAAASSAGLVHLVCRTITVLRENTARRALSGPHWVHARQWSSLAMSSPSGRGASKSYLLASYLGEKVLRGSSTV